MLRMRADQIPSSSCYLCCMVHSKAGSRKTEHHEREETCHVHTSLSKGTRISPEVSKVVDSRNVEPEYRVQCMVQTYRD